MCQEYVASVGRLWNLPMLKTKRLLFGARVVIVAKQRKKDGEKKNIEVRIWDIE